MKIGELSNRTGVSIRMLRYYEEQGVLSPKRTVSGYRDFEQTEIRTIKRVKLLALAGMNLATIIQFLPCIKGEGNAFEPCDELRVLLYEQIEIANKKAEQLAESRKILDRFLLEIEK
jgi:DNA-binding transcriptional MerR regulator